MLAHLRVYNKYNLYNSRYIFVDIKAAPSWALIEHRGYGLTPTYLA